MVIVLSVIIGFLSGLVAVFYFLQATRHKREVQDAGEQIDMLRQTKLQSETQLVQLQQSLSLAEAGDKQKIDWLDAQQKEIEWLRKELESRPQLAQKRYKIITLGIKYTGKTSLTLKWANPLIDLGKLQGTKIERYERTVSHIAAKDLTTNHVFEIGDWGGEHLVDAHQELIMAEIHGLLMVVDLTGKDGQRLDPARIQEQLREFQPQSLQYFFGPKVLATCKAVVLFINKSDVLSGTPAEVEQEARAYYKPLIDGLERYKNSIDIRVLVGSASYGHNTHCLFSHFVERILPRTAYDAQLLQRMKEDSAPQPALTQTAPLPMPVQVGSVHAR